MSLRIEKPMGWEKRTGRYDVLEVKQVGHGRECDWPCQMLLPAKKRKDGTVDTVCCTRW